MGLVSEKPKKCSEEYELSPEEATLLTEFVARCLELGISFGIAFDAGGELQRVSGFLIEVGGVPIADRNGWQIRFKSMEGALRAGDHVLDQIISIS